MATMGNQPDRPQQKMMCRKRKRPAGTAAAAAKNSHRTAAASVCGLTTALVIVGSSLAAFVAATAGGEVDATHQMRPQQRWSQRRPQSMRYLRHSAAASSSPLLWQTNIDDDRQPQGQYHQNSRQLQSYNGVLIHLESQCNACIGINTIVGVAQPGSNITIVDCADSSTNLLKLWDFSQSGNLCLQNSEICVLYNPTNVQAFGDLLSLQSRELNPEQFENQNQKWFWESTGELTRSPDQNHCLVQTGTAGVELRPCDQTEESKRQWTLVTPAQFGCDVDSLTGFPTASPTSVEGGGGGGDGGGPSASPTLAPAVVTNTEVPTTLQPVSSSPTTAAPVTDAPTTAAPTSDAPTSAPSSAPVATVITPSPTVTASSSPSSSPSSEPSLSPSASSPGTGTPTSTSGSGNTTDSNTDATEDVGNATSTSIDGDSGNSNQATGNATSSGDGPSDNENGTTTTPTGDNSTADESKGDGSATDIGIGSGSGEEYNDGITSEVGDQTIKTKRKRRKKKGGGGNSNGDGKEGGGGGTKKKKRRKKNKNKQGQVEETKAPSNVPSISPTLPPSPAKKKKKKNGKKKKKKKQNGGGEVENVTDMPSGAPSSPPTTLAPSTRPSISPTDQASSSPSSSPSTTPSLAPTPDDGITTTDVAMTLSVSYPDTTDTESLLSIVDSSAGFVFQRQLQNSATYLYRLSTDDALDADTFDVQSRVNATTCGEASVSQEEGEESIQCGVLGLSVSVDHADTASTGEVRYAIMTLIPDLIERLELQSRDIASATNLGSRAVPYTIVSSLSGVADTRPASANAIAAYEMALQRVLSSQPASLGLDILHIEVKSTSVRTVNNAGTDDNIFDKDPEHDQKDHLDAKRKLQTDGASNRIAEVTFETLILSEYASEMFPDVNVNALLDENSGQVLTLLKLEGGPYFQGVDSFELVTQAPTMAPTEQNPSGPSPGAETSGSDSGLSSVVKGAIAASVSIVSIALLGIGAYLCIRRRQNEKAKKMMNDDEFDALQRERRNNLASRNDDFGGSPDTTFATRPQRDVDANDTMSEASRRRRDDEYGWNQVPLDDEFADALEQPAQATRTDLTSRWAGFEQDETLEEQKTEANANAVLMGLRNTIRRAWQGTGTDDDEEQQSADEDSALEEGARGMEAENDQDFLDRLQQMYVRGEISRGEFITLKESHLRKVKMQEEEERLAAEAAGTAAARVPDDESSMFSTNPEIERMLQEGRITEEEYRNLVETHQKLKMAQDSSRNMQQDEEDVEDYGYEDHQPTARHDDESFFREKDDDMERLYQDGQITRAELEEMKAANERLRKSQAGDGFLEDMSADGDEYYDEAPVEDEPYTDDEGIYTEGDESSSFFSNNDEIDKLYRDGKISAAEWRQMKNTHEALRQEQRRASVSDDEHFDEYNEHDDADDGAPENEWGDSSSARRSEEEEIDDEAFEEEERLRAQEEEQEAVRRRVAEQFREAEERARADRAQMEDYWRSDDNEDEKDSEYDDEEAYDDFDENQSLGTKGTLFTTTNPGNEIQRLYEEGQISATERDQMLHANSQLKHAGEGDDDASHFTTMTTSNEIQNLYNAGKISEEERDQMLQANRALKMQQQQEEEEDGNEAQMADDYADDYAADDHYYDDEEEGKDEESLGTMLTAGNAIDDMFKRGEINEEEYQAMSRQHRALQKEQKRAQKLEEIERMYEQGDVDSTDYRLLVDSYERLQQDPRHQSAGSNIEMSDMSARNLSQPAQNSREVVAPELTPDDTSIGVGTINPEIEALWREGMLSRQEYEAMTATHQRLKEVQSGGKKYQASRGGPALW